MNNSLFQLLGLAFRAGKIVHGEESILREVQSQKAKLVILADDAGPNTSKRLMDKCKYYRVPLFRSMDRQQLGNAIGKHERVALCIIDEGFAAKMITLLDESNRG
ncbi:YlxQ family RNA-binding protein [Bacillaceae bacterium S4-13-58]